MRLSGGPARGQADRLLRTILVAATLLAVASSGAAAAVPASLSRAGRWLTDSSGRVVVLHGVNLVYKERPWYPSAGGFGADDARLLAAAGLNVVRLGFAWSQAEPLPGVYNSAYIAQIVRTQQLLARFGIYSLIDSHQDLFTTKVSGDWNGFPAWAAIDDGLPVQPAPGFPWTYFVGPAENAAWQNFWDDAPAGGVGLQEHYATMWRHVASVFANLPYVAGYDLINEPWPGPGYAPCIQPNGCPAFEEGRLAALEAKAIRAVRDVDRRHLVFYEPAVTNQAGSKVWVPNPTGDRQAGMSFHAYCTVTLVVNGSNCDQQEQLELDNGLSRAKANGNDPAIVTEFGATSDATSITTQAERFDRARAPWIFWAYNENVVRDMRRPATAANVNLPVLAALARPYPKAVAGTPDSWSFNRATTTFRLVYSTARVTHGSFPAGSVTEISTPRLVFPHGYRAQVSGGVVVSRPRAAQLVIASCPTARTIRVSVAAGVRRSGSCRLRLRLSVRSQMIRRAHRIRLRFHVTAAIGSFTMPVQGALIDLGGRRVLTDRAGAAVLTEPLSALRRQRVARVTAERDVPAQATISPA